MTSNALHALVTDAGDDDLVAVPAEAAAVPEGCLLDVLGIRLTHVGRGRSRVAMVVGPEHLNQRGLPQGGALVALADAAAGFASYAALPEGLFTTLELKCNLLGRAKTGGTLLAVTTPVHLGRTTLVLDVDLFSADQEQTTGRRRLVARFSCTQMVLKSS